MILSFRIGTAKNANTDHRVKETRAIMSTEVNMKPTTSLYCAIQQYQVH